MFAFGIRYLNGWSMAAADGARKERAEWPPHPDRLFMALAAAWFETGEDAGEGEALRWLEGLPSPAIAASDAVRRTTVVSYVPVNDTQAGRKMPAGGNPDKLKAAGLALLPEHRPRQPRGFPVAIPRNPAVHFIWPDASLDGRRLALERLAAKVTHMGHSASFVQAWIEETGTIATTWEPTDGIAEHRLRVPSAGRLDELIRACNRGAWIEYHDLKEEIKQAAEDTKARKHPPRFAWDAFPDVVLLAREHVVKQHPKYPAAKTGDAASAADLVDELVDGSGIDTVRKLIDESSESRAPILVAAHAYEREGVNTIPSALGKLFSGQLGIEFEAAVIQANIVSHTGAGGYGRLARQASFEGGVEAGREYVMVDDFIGQGGTLANLRGWIRKQGGKVIGAVALTGKPYSAKLKLAQEQLDELRQRHGKDFEKWWREHFGHSFDCLTQSEARYLARSPDVDTIRARLAAAQQEGSSPGRARNLREQKRLVKELQARLEDRFPNGRPLTMRPAPNRWQSYGRPPKADAVEAPGSVFDPRLIVLGITGKRVSLPATLKLTAALRGALMSACPEQPPPEWFSGHKPGGGPTAEQHLALFPLPFVGDRHADGRIMGLALALPRALDPQEIDRCLEAFLYDADGLPRRRRLFDGRWFECEAALETGERSLKNLDPDTWARASRVWASVTPVVLNRHFGGGNKWRQAAESLKEACGHSGLPRPCEALLHAVSMVEGAPHAREYPQLLRKSDGGRQSHGHAVVVFDEPVRGPVLLGAGRFRGYGLFRPMDGTGNGGG